VKFGNLDLLPSNIPIIDFLNETKFNYIP